MGAMLMLPRQYIYMVKNSDVREVSDSEEQEGTKSNV